MLNEKEIFNKKSHDPRELLKFILNNYKVTLQTLNKITGISQDTILNFANGKDDLSTLSTSQRLDFIDLIGLLSFGMLEVDQSERVRAIIQVLNNKFELSIETIALYAKIDSKDLHNFLNDNNSISIDKKYKLAVTALFLYSLCK